MSWMFCFTTAVWKMQCLWLQALQHTWMLSAGSGDDDLEECSLDWDEENEYNMMVRLQLKNSRCVATV